MIKKEENIFDVLKEYGYIPHVKRKGKLVPIEYKHENYFSSMNEHLTHYYLHPERNDYIDYGLYQAGKPPCLVTIPDINSRKYIPELDQICFQKMTPTNEFSNRLIEKYGVRKVIDAIHNNYILEM